MGVEVVNEGGYVQKICPSHRRSLANFVPGPYRNTEVARLPHTAQYRLHLPLRFPL